MASIFRATDMRTAAPWPSSRSRDGSDPVLFDRFARGADRRQAGPPGRHEGVGGEDRSQVYMVMEWVERLLRQVLAEQGEALHPRAVKITSPSATRWSTYTARRGASRPEAGEHHDDAEDRIKIIASASPAGRFAALDVRQAVAGDGTPEYISPSR